MGGGAGSGGPGGTLSGGTGGASQGGASGSSTTAPLDYPGLTLPDADGTPCEYPGSTSTPCKAYEVCRIYSPTEGRCEYSNGCRGYNAPCSADTSPCCAEFQCFKGSCTTFCTLDYNQYDSQCGSDVECVDVGHETRGLCEPHGGGISAGSNCSGTATHCPQLALKECGEAIGCHATGTCSGPAKCSGKYPDKSSCEAAVAAGLDECVKWIHTCSGYAAFCGNVSDEDCWWQPGCYLP